MKKFILKFKWYHMVIILFVCVLSILCWGKFVKKLRSVVNITGTHTVTDNYIERFNGYIDNINYALNDMMFKKKYFCRVDTVYTYLTTRESSTVISGKNRWLFYKGENSIEDYVGANQYSSEDMKDYLNEALATQDKLNSRNIKFAIMIAPNKENIYSEYMPSIYTHADVSRTDILIDYLEENGVNIVSPKQELLEYNDKFQLYYRYDTHWNQLGAYIGVKNVLDSWNISEHALAERSISSYNLAENYHYCALGDLANVVCMRSLLYDDETEYEVEGTEIVNWGKYEDEQNSGEVSYFYNEDAQINAKLLLVGDSFRTSMIPSLSEVFSDVYVVYRSNYYAELLDEIEPEYLIAEYVERYSSGIGEISFLIEN
jgi:hypothetical protein